MGQKRTLPYGRCHVCLRPRKCPWFVSSFSSYNKKKKIGDRVVPLCFPLCFKLYRRKAVISLRICQHTSYPYKVIFPHCDCMGELTLIKKKKHCSKKENISLYFTQKIINDFVSTIYHFIIFPRGTVLVTKKDQNERRSNTRKNRHQKC